MKPKMLSLCSNGCGRDPRVGLSICDVLGKLEVNQKSVLDVSLGGEAGPTIPAYCCLATGQPAYTDVARTSSL